MTDWILAWEGAGRLALVLVAVAAAIALARAGLQLRSISRGRRAILLGLRLLALVAALGAALGPVIRRQKTVRDRSAVLVLVDTSESTRVPLPETGTGGPSRHDRAAELLRRSRASLERLGDDHRVSVFAFGDELADASLDRELPHPSGGTKILEALSAGRARVEGRELGAVILVSDGVDHGRLGARLEARERAALGRLGAPVHTVLLAEEAPIPDLSIADVRMDPVGFVGDPVETEVTVHREGLATPSVPVTLLRNGRVVAEQTARFGATGDARVRFEFVPDRVGRTVYRVSVPQYDGDAVPDNNARDVLLEVTRGRMRILLVCGRPTWDERFLRRTLQKDPSVDLISFFILRTLTDLPLSSSDELSLIPFPTQELFENHLPSFDVVIFQNFDHGPYEVSAHLPRIRDWVKGGGAFVMVGGDLSFASGGYAGTAVEEILPVTLPPGDRASPELLDTAAFRPVLTEEGARHPVTMLGPAGPENVRAWQALVPLEGVNLLAGPAPGAVVLLEHPSLHAASGGHTPLVAAREVGRGRTLAVATDSQWRWAFEQAEAGGDPREYELFWDNAMRWLTHDPALERLRVFTDGDRTVPGAKIDVRLELRDRSFRPANGESVSLELVPMDGGPAVASSTGVVDEAGSFRAAMRAPPPGAYRIVAHATLAPREGLPAEELTAEEVILSMGATEELAVLAPRPGVLRSIARATKGRFVHADVDLGTLPIPPPRAARVESREDAPLLERAWFLALVVALLAAEWAVRRRWGYP